MTTAIYYPVPTFANALDDVIADVRGEFPTWDADPSDPGYYIAELIAQQRIDNRTMINESRKALIWPITPGVDGASGEDLLELARSVSIDSKLPDETDGELLRRMNDRWVGLSETDERVRLLVLDTPYQYTAAGASQPTTFRVIDVSTEDGSGYNKTIYIQTDLSQASTAIERQTVEDFLDGPTGSPWYVIPTVSAETRTPYDLTAKVQYRGNLAELEAAVRAALTAGALKFQRLDTALYDDGLKEAMWYENDATNTSVLDFPIFTMSFESPLTNGDKAAAVDTLYYLRSSHVWFKMVEDTPDAPTIAVTAAAARLNVAITAGDANGKPITSYEVQYREATATEWTDWTEAAVNQTITGLTAATVYDVRARAINAEGNGDWSAVSQGTPS